MMYNGALRSSLNSFPVQRLIVQRLPELQVVSVGEPCVFAELPVGSVVQPHLSASLVQVFPEGIKKKTNTQAVVLENQVFKTIKCF